MKFFYYNYLMKFFILLIQKVALHIAVENLSIDIVKLLLLNKDINLNIPTINNLRF